MPGCTVTGCTNSRAKGFLMKTFPRDPTRRQLWTAAINRPDIKLTSYATICEIHFSDDAWEKVRVDGTRKLKISATPTLLIQTPNNKEHNHQAEPTTVVEPAVDTNNSTDAMEQQDKTSTDNNLPEVEQGTLSSSSQSSSPELDHCIKLLERSSHQRRILEKKLKAVRLENKRLQTSIQKSSEVRTYLNDDQQEIIQKQYKKCRKWSIETLKKASKLKFACGNTGYKELLKQKIPLPSLRTLSRRLHRTHFPSSTQNDTLDLPKTKFSTGKHDRERECVLVFQ